MPTDPTSLWPGLRFDDDYWDKVGLTSSEHVLRRAIVHHMRLAAQKNGTQVPVGVDALIQAIQVTERMLQELKDVQALLVAEARAAEMTWTEIGRPLAITRTGAQKRFGKERLAEAKERSCADLSNAKELVDKQIEQAGAFCTRYGLDRRPSRRGGQ